MVSYGLAYGMEAYGLGSDCRFPPARPRSSSTPTSRRFPNVKAYMERTVAEARERATPRRCSAGAVRFPSSASNCARTCDRRANVRR
jgi:DNA polymerase-1